MRTKDEFFARFDCGRQGYGYTLFSPLSDGDDFEHSAHNGTRDRVHGEITGLGRCDGICGDAVV